MRSVARDRGTISPSAELSAERLKHLRDFQELNSAECLKLMSEATGRFLRRHPEIGRARRKALKAGKRWRPGKGWELEMVRGKAGKYFRVVEVVLPPTK